MDNNNRQNILSQTSDDSPSQPTIPTLTTVSNNQQIDSTTEPPLPDAVIKARDKVNEFYRILAIIFAPICIIGVIVALLLLFVFPGSGN